MKNTNDKNKLNKIVQFIDDEIVLECEPIITKLSPNDDEDKDIKPLEEDICEKENIDNDDDEQYIDDVDNDFNLNGIIYSEDYHDKKNIIDEIESPEVLELIIFEELDSMIKVDHYELEEIKFEIEILNDKEEDALLLKEIKDLQKQLDEIISHFEKIQNKYENFYEYIDYNKIRQIDSLYMKDLLDDYKNFLKDDRLLDDNLQSIEDIEEYIGIIENIIEVEQQKEKIKDKIDDKLNKFDIRDSEFDKIKDQYLSVDKINDFVTKFNKEQAANLDKLKSLIDKSISIEKRTEVTVNLCNLVMGTLLLASTSLIPPTKTGNILRMGLMVASIVKINNIIKREEKEEINLNFDIRSYEYEMNSSIEGITNIIKNIDNAFRDIDLIRKNIKKELGDYVDAIPEFKELYKNLNQVEKALMIQQGIAKNYSNEFSRTLHENNDKIKKLDKNVN